MSQHFLVKQFSGPPNWLISIGGHHGKYCSDTPHLLNAPFEGPNETFDALKEQLLEELIGYFGPLSDEKISRSGRLHLFTGFIIFSDWIGSNIDWFPLSGMSDREVLLSKKVAMQRARKAIEQIGWQRRKIERNLTFGELFRADDSTTFEPRPLQESLIQAVDASGLYILEAPMGGG